MNNLVLVVDMIKGFVNEGALCDPDNKKLIPNIISLLNHYKDNIFINDAHSDNSKEFKWFPKHCLKNSVEGEIVEELKPLAKEIVYKNSTNGFFSLNKAILNKYDNIVITGVCSDICILQVALTLNAYFNEINSPTNVIVVEDAINTYTLDGHDANEYNDIALKLMRNSNIKIVNTRDLINE